MLNKIYKIFFQRIKFNRVISVKRYGIVFILWLSDFTSRKIFLGYNYEGKDLNFIKELLIKDDYCIDIGSNIGYYSLHFSKSIGNNGKVFSFEPNKRSYLMLKLSAELNNFTNIYCYNKVLGSSAHKEFKLINTGTDSTIDYFVENNKVSDSSNYISTTLDKLLFNDELLEKKIKIMKIDVEGAEFEVLKGSSQILKSEYKPCYIMLEVFVDFCARFNYSPNELYDFLYSYGYTKIFYIDKKLIKIILSKDEFYYFKGNVFFTTENNFIDNG